jgi:Ca-activated chloride channel family protein
MSMPLSFAHPAVLFFLMGPAALLAWVWRHPGHRIALPFDHGTQPEGRNWRFVINLAESLPALLLGVVIIILAGPQRQSEPVTRRALTNIEFCVDISGSMTAPFGDGSRYDASMRAINDFLGKRAGDSFGLTFFGSSVLHWVPLTNDTSALKCAPPFMRPERVPPWFGGTEIVKALRACQAVLREREQGDRMIILVTDGISMDLMSGNESEVAAELRKDNITVYAIHAAETEIPPPIVNLTAYTGGEAFAAGDPASLEAIFARIDAMNLAKLEKTAPETMDHFGPWCLMGISLLGMLGGALFGVRYTPW